MKMEEIVGKKNTFLETVCHLLYGLNFMSSQILRAHISAVIFFILLPTVQHACVLSEMAPG